LAFPHPAKRKRRWRRGKVRIDQGKRWQLHFNSEGIGDANVSEAGRQLLAKGFRLLEAEQRDQTITRVFRASRNAERDQPAEAWAAEFVRKANTIISACC
jgi:hypothetical protein